MSGQKFDKLEWQRNQRRKFDAEKGFSSAGNYACGGIREQILERDNYSCVKCGMTDEQHKAKWGRPITVDHKDRDRSHNTPDNLQTLCLACHGRKDILQRLIEPRAPAKKEEILLLRRAGKTYQQIADDCGYSIAVVWKWIKRWEKQTTT